jgi:hypothetical protein
MSRSGGEPGRPRALSDAQTAAVRAAIYSAQNVDEVDRLEEMILSGIIPGLDPIPGHDPAPIPGHDPAAAISGHDPAPAARARAIFMPAPVAVPVGRAKAPPRDPEEWRRIQDTVAELNRATRARKAAAHSPPQLPPAFRHAAPSGALEDASPRRKLHPVDASADDGMTPLFAAAWAGHVDVLQALIDSGADVDRAVEGAAPLYGAARHGQLCVLVALLDGGAQVDGINAGGETSLLAAAERGHWDVARALLAFGADPNLGIDHGGGRRTPLRAAVQSGDLGAVRALVRSGAVAKTPEEEEFVADDVLRLDFQKQKACRR